MASTILSFFHWINIYILTASLPSSFLPRIHSEWMYEITSADSDSAERCSVLRSLSPTGVPTQTTYAESSDDPGAPRGRGWEHGDIAASFSHPSKSAALAFPTARASCPTGTDASCSPAYTIKAGRMTGQSFGDEVRCALSIGLDDAIRPRRGERKVLAKGGMRWTE